jgi:hypothetical protein
MALTKITNDLLDLGSDTGALGLPKGTEAQRPSNPVEGTLRHNSEIDETKLETFNGADWRKINKFVTPLIVDYLVIAGGGGTGGSADGGVTGGGGAGGYRTTYGTSGANSSSESTITLNSGNVYTITVGAGGAAQSTATGGVGGNSSIAGTGLTEITSLGGGGGGGWYQNATGGGSGGGASWNRGIGTGTSNQGFEGGTANAPGCPNNGGGGGGAGEAGQPGYQNVDYSGRGGNGISSSITGSAIARAGGGGGGCCNENADRGGRGGTGGGGNGGTWQYSGAVQAPQNGVANTGGGAGGQGAYQQPGRTGGSGVVILRMPTANYSGTTTGSPTVTTDGTDTILTYTSSGTYTA